MIRDTPHKFVSPRSAWSEHAIETKELTTNNLSTSPLWCSRHYFLFQKKKQDGGDITNPTSNPGYLSFRSFFLYDKGGHVWVKKREKSALPCVKLGGYLFQTSILGFWDVFIDKN